MRGSRSSRESASRKSGASSVSWELEQHPHEPLRRAQALPEQQRVARLAEIYGVDRWRIEAFFAKHLRRGEKLADRTGGQPNNGVQPSAADTLLIRRG